MAAFNDHAVVVVLDFLVTKLINDQCLAAPDYKSAAAEWREYLEKLKADVHEIAFTAGQSDDAQLNAVDVIGELDRKLEELGFISSVAR
jgi:hypothetical protein